MYTVQQCTVLSPLIRLYPVYPACSNGDIQDVPIDLQDKKLTQ